MMEIEHFVNPEKRQKFGKFDRLADLRVKLFSACNQMEGKPAEDVTLRRAVDEVNGTTEELLATASAPSLPPRA